MADNPLTIMSDPEFVKLNPGLSQTNQEAGAALLSLSNSSDVIEQLTAYIASGPGCHGVRQRQGATRGAWSSTRSTAKLPMPRSDIPLLDSYIPKTQSDCRQKNPDVYFNQLAAPVSTLRKVAEALLDSWPNVQTRCEFDTSTGLYKLGRIDRQSFGSRFMLGIVSLGDAERYGLRPAALETKAGQVRRADRPFAGGRGQADDAEGQVRAVRPRPG